MEEGQRTSWGALWGEAARLMQLAVPILTQNALFTVLSIITTSFIGHLNEPAILSGAILGTSFYNVTGFSICIGLTTALDTLAGQAYGAGSFKLLGVLLQRSMLVSCSSAIPIVIAWTQAHHLMTWLQQPPEAVYYASLYLYRIIPGMFVQIISACINRYFTAQQMTTPGAVATMCQLAATPVFYYLMIQRYKLGIEGAAYAYVMSSTVYGAALMIQLLRHHRRLASDPDRQTWHGFSWDAWKGWGYYMKVAVPACAMICVEWWTFEVVIFMAGWLPNGAVATGVMGLCSQIVNVLWILPFSVGCAANTLVANELGAGSASGARRVFLVCVNIAFGMQTVLCSAAFLARDYITTIFTTNPEVVAMTRHSIQYAIANSFCDGVAGALSGVLRGAGRQALGAFLGLFTFWIFGLPLAATLGFYPPIKLGITGFWLALACVMFVQMNVLLITLCATNWKNEVKRAQHLIQSQEANLERADSVGSSLVEPLLAEYTVEGALEARSHSIGTPTRRSLSTPRVGTPRSPLRPGAGTLAVCAAVDEGPEAEAQRLAEPLLGESAGREGGADAGLSLEDGYSAPALADVLGTLARSQEEQAKAVDAEMGLQGVVVVGGDGSVGAGQDDVVGGVGTGGRDDVGRGTETAVGREGSLLQQDSTILSVMDIGVDDVPEVFPGSALLLRVAMPSAVPRQALPIGPGGAVAAAHALPVLAQPQQEVAAGQRHAVGGDDVSFESSGHITEVPPSCVVPVDTNDASREELEHADGAVAVGGDSEVDGHLNAVLSVPISITSSSSELATVSSQGEDMFLDDESAEQNAKHDKAESEPIHSPIENEDEGNRAAQQQEPKALNLGTKDQVHMDMLPDSLTAAATVRVEENESTKLGEFGCVGVPESESGQKGDLNHVDAPESESEQKGDYGNADAPESESGQTCDRDHSTPPDTRSVPLDAHLSAGAAEPPPPNALSHLSPLGLPVDRSALPPIEVRPPPESAALLLSSSRPCSPHTTLSVDSFPIQDSPNSASNASGPPSPIASDSELMEHGSPGGRVAGSPAASPSHADSVASHADSVASHADSVASHADSVASHADSVASQTTLHTSSELETRTGTDVGTTEHSVNQASALGGGDNRQREEVGGGVDSNTRPSSSDGEMSAQAAAGSSPCSPGSASQRPGPPDGMIMDAAPSGSNRLTAPERQLMPGLLADVVASQAAGDSSTAADQGDESGVGPMEGAVVGAVGGGVPDVGAADVGTPDGGAADHSAADVGAPDAGAADCGASDDGAADDSAADDGAGDDGAGDDGAADDGAADDGAADVGAPDVGAPDDGAADVVVADSRAPDVGTPDDGAAGDGAADDGAADISAADDGAPDGTRLQMPTLQHSNRTPSAGSCSSQDPTHSTTTTTTDPSLHLHSNPHPPPFPDALTPLHPILTGQPTMPTTSHIITGLHPPASLLISNPSSMSPRGSTSTSSSPPVTPPPPSVYTPASEIDPRYQVAADHAASLVIEQFLTAPSEGSASYDPLSTDSTPTPHASGGRKSSRSSLTAADISDIHTPIPITPPHDYLNNATPSSMLSQGYQDSSGSGHNPVLPGLHLQPHLPVTTPTTTPRDIAGTCHTLGADVYGVTSAPINNLTFPTPESSSPLAMASVASLDMSITPPLTPPATVSVTHTPLTSSSSQQQTSPPFHPDSSVSLHHPTLPVSVALSPTLVDSPSPAITPRRLSLLDHTSQNPLSPSLPHPALLADAGYPLSVHHTAMTSPLTGTDSAPHDLSSALAESASTSPSITASKPPDALHLHLTKSPAQFSDTYVGAESACASGQAALGDDSSGVDLRNSVDESSGSSSGGVLEGVLDAILASTVRKGGGRRGTSSRGNSISSGAGGISPREEDPPCAPCLEKVSPSSPQDPSVDPQSPSIGGFSSPVRVGSPSLGVLSSLGVDSAPEGSSASSGAPVTQSLGSKGGSGSSTPWSDDFEVRGGESDPEMTPEWIVVSEGEEDKEAKIMRLARASEAQQAQQTQGTHPDPPHKIEEFVQVQDTARDQPHKTEEFIQVQDSVHDQRSEDFVEVQDTLTIESHKGDEFVHVHDTPVVEPHTGEPVAQVRDTPMRTAPSPTTAAVLLAHPRAADAAGSAVVATAEEAVGPHPVARGNDAFPAVINTPDAHTTATTITTPLYGNTALDEGVGGRAEGVNALVTASSKAVQGVGGSAVGADTDPSVNNALAVDDVAAAESSSHARDSDVSAASAQNVPTSFKADTPIAAPPAQSLLTQQPADVQSDSSGRPESNISTVDTSQAKSVQVQAPPQDSSTGDIGDCKAASGDSNTPIESDPRPATPKSRPRFRRKSVSRVPGAKRMNVDAAQAATDSALPELEAHLDRAAYAASAITDWLQWSAVSRAADTSPLHTRQRQLYRVQLQRASEYLQGLVSQCTRIVELQGRKGVSEETQDRLSQLRERMGEVAAIMHSAMEVAHGSMVNLASMDGSDADASALLAASGRNFMSSPNVEKVLFTPDAGFFLGSPEVPSPGNLNFMAIGADSASNVAADPAVLHHSVEGASGILPASATKQMSRMDGNEVAAHSERCAVVKGMDSSVVEETAGGEAMREGVGGTPGAEGGGTSSDMGDGTSGADVSGTPGAVGTDASDAVGGGTSGADGGGTNGIVGNEGSSEATPLPTRSFKAVMEKLTTLEDVATFAPPDVQPELEGLEVMSAMMAELVDNLDDGMTSCGSSSDLVGLDDTAGSKSDSACTPLSNHRRRSPLTTSSPICVDTSQESHTPSLSLEHPRTPPPIQPRSDPTPTTSNPVPSTSEPVDTRANPDGRATLDSCTSTDTDASADTGACASMDTEAGICGDTGGGADSAGTADQDTGSKADMSSGRQVRARAPSPLKVSQFKKVKLSDLKSSEAGVERVSSGVGLDTLTA